MYINPGNKPLELPVLFGGCFKSAVFAEELRISNWIRVHFPTTTLRLMLSFLLAFQATPMLLEQKQCKLNRADWNARRVRLMIV